MEEHDHTFTEGWWSSYSEIGSGCEKKLDPQLAKDVKPYEMNKKSKERSQKRKIKSYE